MVIFPNTSSTSWGFASSGREIVGILMAAGLNLADYHADDCDQLSSAAMIAINTGLVMVLIRMPSRAKVRPTL